MANPIYLDYNASTPIAPEVREAMMPYLAGIFGNPSSSHAFGREAREGIERARRQVAALLGCEAAEIIFTSGATESNNMVLLSAAARAGKKTRIITSAVEHPAVLEPCRFLEKQGHRLTYLPVDRSGMVDPQDLEKSLARGAALVSIMHANNEVGTIQPLAELARIAAARKAPFHTDAAQSAGKVRCRVDELGVDFLTIAGHKFHAPKGVGALYIRKGRNISPLLHGAGHEQGLRPGTENLASIVGLGKACEIAGRVIEAEGLRQAGLGRRLFDGLRQAGFNVHVNGHPEKKLPNTWNISFEGFDAPAVMKALDGVAVSPGAACHGSSVAMSHVLAAMGVPKKLARGAIRFSLGRETTEQEIDRVLQMLKEKLYLHKQ